jgi:hypothetical protein
MPTKTLADVRLIMSGLIQDTAGKLAVTTRNQAIQAAVKLHSTLVPAKKFQIVTGVRNDTVRTPTGWIDEVSQIIQIEYPLGNRPPTYLEEEDFQVIPAVTGSTAYRLLFVSHSIGSAEQVGVRFSAPHKLGVTANQNTIPDHHVDGLAYLSAHLACNQLAGFHTQSNDSGIQADSVNHQQKNSHYLNLSKAYKQYYFDFFKIDERGMAKAASINIDIDRKFQWGDDMFYHPRRWR